MAAVGSGLFLATIDGSIVNVSLPILERELNAPFALIQWVVLGYLLIITSLMLTIGRLADMFGKKPLFLSGYIIFTLGSALCGLSSSAEQLIASRIFQAVGAAMTMALGTAIITEAFPPEERGQALGISGALVSIGLMAGAPLGGLILGSLTWHWVFFVNLPVGLVGILLVIRFIPSWKPPGGQRFDIAGALNLFACLVTFLLGLSIGQDSGFSNPVVISLLGTSLVLLATFLAIELKARQPMIDLSMFKEMLFSVNLVTGTMTFICSAGVVLIAPFYLQNVLDFSAQKAGALLTTVPIAMGIMAPLAGRLSDRYGTRVLTAIGLAIGTCGYLAVSTLNENSTALGYLLCFLPVGVGMGVFQSPNNSAVMGAVPRYRLGVASGLLSISRTIGQVIGISLVGTFWATQVRVLGFTAGDTTSAPAAIQAAALQQTMRGIVVILSIALGLSLWAFFKERSLMASRETVEAPAEYTKGD
jgi:EmrB/QacA subfamily drug resistance transporter